MLPVSASTIRVAVLDGVKSVDVSGGPMRVGDLAGRMLTNELPGIVRASRKAGGIEVAGKSVAAVRLVPMIGILRVNKRDYPGAIEIIPSGDSLVVINELPLEEYLAGAVKAEAGDKMPLQMLKAQAIVARTYAAYHQRLNEHKPYHVMASTAHQQYMGSVPDDSPVWKAVRETEGRVMLLSGALFPAFYHTDSGGHTEDPRVVFGTANMPPLRPVRVDFATDSPHDAWKLDVPLSVLGAQLVKHGISIGKVIALEVLERSSSLRVSVIAVKGLKGTATLRGNDLRRFVGYDTLKSTLFAVAVDGSIARFAGRGYGHGVGLDQWRAKTMADLGYDAYQILEYYYPGAVLSSL